MASTPAQLQIQAKALRPSLAASMVASLWPFVLAIAVGLMMHWWIRPWVGGFATNILTGIGINIMLAVSLNVVNGFTGQFSIGHAGFMAVGGYTAAMLVYYGSIKLWGSADFAGGAISYGGAGEFDGPLIGKGDVLFLISCLVGGVVAAGAGYIVGLPSLRLRGDYLAIVTLGFGEIVRVLLQGTMDQLPPWKAAELANVPWYQIPLMLGGPRGFNLLPTYATLFWIYLFVVLTLIIVFRLKTSSSGRAFLSIREDEIAAQAMGVDITRYKVRAFVLASFFAGVAGALYAMFIGALNASELGFQKSFDIVIMVVLGGLGSISGAALAAVILTILPEVLRDPSPVVGLLPYGIGLAAVLLIVAIVMRVLHRRSRPWWWATAWTGGAVVLIELINIAASNGVDLGRYRMIAYALLLILMMIVRPQGLFGVKEIWDYLPGRRSRGGASTKAGAR
jgi:branched-chain amino acid transport system permease protein